MAVKKWFSRYSHRKQNLAVRKWRMRARMIDFKRTKLILVGTETGYPYGVVEDVRPVEDPKDLLPPDRNLHSGDHAETEGTPNSDSEVSVSFEPASDY